jgi:hypothetical protein
MWLGARESPAGNDVNNEKDDIVGICYPATTGEDTEDLEDLACAVVRSRVRELATCGYNVKEFNKSNYQSTIKSWQYIEDKKRNFGMSGT